MPRVPERFRRKAVKTTAIETRWAIKDVIAARNERANATTKYAGYGAGLGGSFGVFAAIQKNPAFLDGMKIITNVALLGGAVATASSWGIHSVPVRRATKAIGRVMANEVKHNSELKVTLKAKRYVYVDWQGNIKLTNMPRLFGVGRIRLSTAKILADKY